MEEKELNLELARERTRLAEKRTKLAEKRTRMAYERTLMANLRTATTIILFGIAFIGLAESSSDFFFISGLIAISIGVLMLTYLAIRSFKHLKEIEEINDLFKTLWFFDDLRDKDEKK